MEEQYYAKYNAKELIIKFPDPVLSEKIVKGFSNSITSVTFPFPIVPRECIVKLSDDTNVEKAIKEINRVRFGGGKLQAKKKLSDEQKLKIAPEEIDPLTIYYGNIPHSKIFELKSILKNVDVQVGQNKRKPKSYAFATFRTFEEAVQGFNKSTKKFPPSQFITIRFKRNKTTKQTDDSSSQESPSVISTAPIEQQPTASSTPNLNNENDKRPSKRKYQKKIQNKEKDETVNSSNEIVNGNVTSSKITNHGETSQNINEDKSQPEQLDPNIKIKEEPIVDSKYLGFRRVPFQDDMDGDTDCSESTYRCRSNSLDSQGVRKHREASDDSVLAISDSDDEPHEPKMKKPKLLVLPMELHGSLREVKDEENESTDDEIDDIGDLDFI